MGVPVTVWKGCFDLSWKGLITPQSHGHPAKFSRGLVERILDFGFEQGFWAKGDLLLDCFAGVGCGGVVCANKGLRYVGVELEPRFVAWARENFALHRRTWDAFGDPHPVILCADSRNLPAVLADCVVSSPPWMDQEKGVSAAGPSSGMWKGYQPGFRGTYKSSEDDYGTTPGQLGAMPAGSVDGVLSSPPYAAGTVHDRNGIDVGRCERPGATSQARAAGYGATEGQLGAMPAGSVDGVVSSPPYEGSLNNGGAPEGPGAKSPRDRARYASEAAYQRSRHPLPGADGTPYGDTDGNLGNAAGTTFWEAARDVLRSTHAVCKPGAVAAFVVKPFVRRRKLVDFPGDWTALLTACGFEPFLVAHALLDRVTAEPSLFGGEERTVKSRRSFFRRLAEKKGAPPIHSEQVVFARRV